MKKTLLLCLLLALFSLGACTSIGNLFTKPALQAELVTLDSLSVKPEDSARLAGFGITLTRISESKYLLTQPAAKPGKTKVKNSFNDNSKTKGSQNTGSNNKKSGNTDAFNDNKKQGQQQNVGNADNRKAGQTKIKEADLTWLLWLVPVAIGIYLYWPDIRSWIRKILSAAYGLL